MSTQGEPDDQNERGEDEGLARAKRRGKRYAMAIFVSFAAAFIVLSTWEIVAGVFAYDAPGGVAAHGKLSAACGEPLRAFAASLDRGQSAEAAKGGGGELPRDAPLASRVPELKDRTAGLAALDSVCSHESADLDALAAVRRFVRATDAIGHAEREHEGAIAPLRHDVEAYLTP